MPLPPSMANDFWQFQDLRKRVADTLQIALEVKDSQHKLFGYSADSDTLQGGITH